MFVAASNSTYNHSYEYRRKIHEIRRGKSVSPHKQYEYKYSRFKK